MASASTAVTTTGSAAGGDLEPSLKNLVDQQSLQWIFVGGKGGVGKTTTSCCLAVQMAKVRQNVLVISTDPAHNLSDAFGQKFSKEPTLVNGFQNLFCMEVDTTIDVEAITGQDAGDDPMSGMMKDLMGSVPGIDEAMSFAELMKQVQQMSYSCIIFDTAPTGHTLRLLSFPRTMDSAIGKLLALKSKFSGMLSQVNTLMGGNGPDENQLLQKLEQMKGLIDAVHRQIKDPLRTTFVCVCIPEFLSIYETERLVQELTKEEIDTHNIVVNQVLFPDRDAEDLVEWFDGAKESLVPEAKEIISKTIARKRMQDRYISQIFDLYEDFHIVLMPLLDGEVRGVPSLESFSAKLVNPA